MATGTAQEKSQEQDVSDSKQNEVPGRTTSTDENDLPTEEKKSKPDDFNEWCQKVIRDFEQIQDKHKLDALKERVIQAEEKFESLQEGYSIESRLQETENAIETLKKRLNIPNENSRNVQKNISVSQESVLQRFEEMYTQWNKKWSEIDRASDLCKIHEKCLKFCEERFKLQTKELLRVARPHSRNEKRHIRQSRWNNLRWINEVRLSFDTSYNGKEEQIIQEAYKELARNTVGTELVKIKDEGNKAIKTDKELKNVVPECLEICWITLILKEPMSFEFNCRNAEEGTFEGTTQDKMDIVIKPAIRLNKDTIKIRGMVMQRQVDANKNNYKKAEDNNSGAQTEDHASDYNKDSNEQGQLDLARV